MHIWVVLDDKGQLLGVFNSQDKADIVERGLANNGIACYSVEMPVE